MAMRLAGAMMLAGVCGAAAAQSDATIADRKLVEYGWDVPAPDFIAANIRDMEKRPFDGLIFRLMAGSQVLDPTPWDPAKFQADYDVLPTIAWEKFTDNFVILYAASDQDWFNDDHWQAIEHNTALVAKAAKLGKCVGVCFDAEPYGTNPWDYKKAAHAGEKSFAEYNAIARKRGAQFIRAIEKEFPSPKILTFYLVNLFNRFLDPMTAEERQARLAEHDYALFPAFFEGMLEGSGPGTEFIDGNEHAYYYSESAPYFRAYQAIHGRGPRLIDPALEPLFRSKVRAGQALYIDQYFALRQPQKTYGNFMPNEEQARWFEHNVYWGLYTTDRYVWCYSERMNWWTNENVPAGCEEAIRSARGKIARSEELGFDIAESIAAARQRLEEDRQREQAEAK
jgi:hypothetical protein